MVEPQNRLDHNSYKYLIGQVLLLNNKNKI